MSRCGATASVRPGDYRAGGASGPAAVGRIGIGLASVVQFQPQVVPDDARGDVSRGNGEVMSVLARLQQRPRRTSGRMVPDALVVLYRRALVATGWMVPTSCPLTPIGRLPERWRRAIAAICSSQRYAQNCVPF